MSKQDEPLMRQVKFYASSGSKSDIATVLRDIQRKSVDFGDYAREVKRFFIYRNLVFVLRNESASDDKIKDAAYQAIAFFEGLINAIKHAAGIENQPDTSSHYIPVSAVPEQRSQQPAEVASSNGNGNGNGSSNGRQNQFDISNELFG